MAAKIKEKDLVLISGLEILPPLDAAIIASDDFSKQYDLLVTCLQQLTELKQHVDAEIKQVMSDTYGTTGDTGLVSGDRKYTYIPPTTRLTVDSKRLQEERPEVYAEYAKITQVGPTLKSVKIKKEK